MPLIWKGPHTSLWKDEHGQAFEVTRDRYGIAVVRMVMHSRSSTRTVLS